LDEEIQAEFFKVRHKLLCHKILLDPFWEKIASIGRHNLAQCLKGAIKLPNNQELAGYKTGSEI